MPPRGRDPHGAAGLASRHGAGSPPSPHPHHCEGILLLLFLLLLLLFRHICKAFRPPLFLPAWLASIAHACCSLCGLRWQATSADPSAPLRYSVSAYFGALAAVMAAAAAALLYIEGQVNRQVASRRGPAESGSAESGSSAGNPLMATPQREGAPGDTDLNGPLSGPLLRPPGPDASGPVTPATTPALTPATTPFPLARADATGRAIASLLGGSSVVEGLWFVRCPAGRLFAAQVRRPCGL